jgi:hypothetical protein
MRLFAQSFLFIARFRSFINGAVYGTALIFAASALSAQDVVTPAVGFLAQTIPSGESRPFSLPLLANVDAHPGAQGVITAVGSNYIENSSASLPAGAYSGVDLPFLARITTGPAAGRLFRVATPANTSTRLYLNGDGLILNALGIRPSVDCYELLPADTLDSLFGSDLLQGGPSASMADTVSVWGGASYQVFYYNNVRQRWERDIDTAATPDRGNFVLRSDRGVLIQRRASVPLELIFIGRVSSTENPITHQRPGNTLICTMSPVELTLSKLALDTAARSRGWTGAAQPSLALAQADLIQVWRDGAWLNFYFDTTRSRWQKAGDATNASADAIVIPAGAPIFVRRVKSGASVEEKTLTMPRPGA